MRQEAAVVVVVVGGGGAACTHAAKQHLLAQQTLSGPPFDMAHHRFMDRGGNPPGARVAERRMRGNDGEGISRRTQRRGRGSREEYKGGAQREASRQARREAG